MQRVKVTFALPNQIMMGVHDDESRGITSTLDNLTNLDAWPPTLSGVIRINSWCYISTIGRIMKWSKCNFVFLCWFSSWNSTSTQKNKERKTMRWESRAQWNGIDGNQLTLRRRLTMLTRSPALLHSSIKIIEMILEYDGVTSCVSDRKSFDKLKTFQLIVIMCGNQFSLLFSPFSLCSFEIHWMFFSETSSRVE